jgi:hypothetical protein
MHTPGAMNIIPDMHHISTLTRERIMRTVSILKTATTAPSVFLAIWILRG